jgi:hypothetical protein
VEATFLRPDFDDARADVISDATTEFDFDFEAAPRVWLGVENCCGVGARVRYWEFDAEAEFDNQVIVPSPVNSVVGTSSCGALDTYVVDLEATKRVCRGCSEWLGSFGVRHVGLGYSAEGTFLNVATGVDSDMTTEDLSRRFDGTGLTGALEGRRPFGDGDLALVWSVRGSVVWGDNKANKVEVDIDSDIDGSISVDTDVDVARESDTLFIGELQAGVEWRRPVRCLSCDVFARAVFEGQWWGLDNGTALSSGDALAEGDFALYGASFALGVSR